jgi:hypothetical protein
MKLKLMVGDISGDLCRFLCHWPRHFRCDIPVSACYLVETEENCEEFGANSKTKFLSYIYYFSIGYHDCDIQKLAWIFQINY